MRLGDLDTLKETLSNNEAIRIFNLHYDGLIAEIIDNTPTAEPEKVLVASVTFDEDKLKEIIQTEVIEKIKSGDLVICSEDEWIPVSERLPEEDGIYLVTLEYVEDSEIVYETDMARFVSSEKDVCNNGFHKAYTIIAWRPLPEPFEKGGAE